ncbi:MAG: Tol-Pal system beta propeller repeat protein TolB [Candidatus Latescibacter sp.]|nr:Tol-Pal system beta propeller repeat protein TolB [Candidatus Latescibacter sp.]
MDLILHTFRFWLYNFYFLCILLLVSMAAETSAQTRDIYLQIRAGSASGRIGVGIEGFTSPDPSSPVNIVRDTLIGDLNGSGLFQTRALPDSIASLNKSSFLKWTESGAAYYLSGALSGTGKSVAVKLYDLKTTLVTLDAEYLIDSKRPWYTAHVLVDDMIKMFTGLRGSCASQIAYISESKGGKEIFIIDADGRNIHQLTFSRTINLSPAWSPEGQRIAYSSLNGTNWGLNVININTGQSLNISRWGGLNTSPAWCPTNPDLIAFSSNRDGNTEIYTCRANGTAVKRLTNYQAIDISPAWSPDAAQIAFQSDRTGSPLVYVMNSDGSNIHRLTSTPNSYEDSPNWSPRGDRILFVVQNGSAFDIASSSPTGEDLVMLTMGEGSNENPKWSPDGLRIVFWSTRLGGKSLFIMNWDGSGVRPLTSDGNSFSPSWAPAVSGDDIRVSGKR